MRPGSPAAASRSRTRGWRTATGPIPVMTSRSGRWPWRTRRWRPSSDPEAHMLGEKICDLGLYGLRQQGARPLPEDFAELIVKGSWLNQLGYVIVGHGISRLRWRSGGVRQAPPRYAALPIRAVT